ncbi:hypothetical protein [Actinomyces sp. HMT897]|uniref:hypothetical protein n=1 Tax=Actinomyces sp. HMT897 TaxID=2789424 RepID=UPI00190DBA76|nr:hypothetical protein [Actinomyces sp. HMT897]QQO77091.1 hypothetical protein JJJ15_08350 [Actinomyces sp. HMT897]
MGGDYGVEWGSLRTRDGVGMDPAPIGVMLSAPDSRTANEAYWGIEGTAFYSRQLEEAALPVTRVLVDAVCEGECTYWGTVYATDALVEITCGEISFGEMQHGNEDLDSRCLAVVRARLPRLYQMLEQATDDTILSNLITIVHNTEDDTPTRRALLEKLSHQDLPGPSDNALHWNLVEEYGEDRRTQEQNRKKH